MPSGNVLSFAVRFASLVLVGFFLCVGYLLSPLVKSGAEPVVVHVAEGAGLWEIAEELGARNIIRSPYAFFSYAVVRGDARALKAGIYKLSPSDNIPRLVGILARGEQEEGEIRVPDGASVYLVDKLLAEAGICPEGSFIEWVKKSGIKAEGYLYPDSYRFFLGSRPEDVYAKMRENFDTKTEGILKAHPADAEFILMLASLLEKEVPDYEDQRIVAGLLIKRAKIGMPLQVDATICYAKYIKNGAYTPCTPFSPLDFRIDSEYNSYLRKGWPPGPIGSPVVQAIRAALSPVGSPYWFYLSDPVSKKTIFSKTLDEHSQNRVKYLK